MSLSLSKSNMLRDKANKCCLNLDRSHLGKLSDMKSRLSTFKGLNQG